MNYQDIQDYASELAEIRCGTSCVTVDEFWDDVRSNTSATASDKSAIIYLSKQYEKSMYDIPVDWDLVERNIMEMMR